MESKGDVRDKSDTGNNLNTLEVQEKAALRLINSLP
jgi:hypothetical protein